MSEAKSDDMTVLVSAWSKYADILCVFEQLFVKYWHDCPYDIVLSIDKELSKDHRESCIKYTDVVVSGDKPNAIRVVEALKRIKTPYVLWLVEDFWITKRVDNDELQKYLSFARKYDVAMVRLNKNPWNKDNIFDGNEDIIHIGKSAYRVNIGGVTVWSTKFLVELLEKYDNLWDFERCGSYDKDSVDALIIAARHFEFPIIPAVFRGKIVKGAAQTLADNNIDIATLDRRVESISDILINGIKGVIIRIAPNLVVRLQNRIGAGFRRS